MRIYNQIRNRIQIRGFQFSGYNEKGAKVITIRADKFTVAKKKIGFLTTSLFNIATVKNARIDMYSRGNLPETTTDELKEQFSGLTFDDTFSQDALPALPAKNIASIEIQPVSVNLYNGNSLITSISARSADIKMKQHSMIFQGDVKVISGEKILTTSKLEFIPGKALFKTDSRFVLETKDGRSQGLGMSSDIFLKLIIMPDNPTKNETKSN